MDDLSRLGIAINTVGILVLLLVTLSMVEPESKDFFTEILIGVGVLLAGAGCAMLLARKPPAS